MGRQGSDHRVLVSVYDILARRTVTDHGDGISDLLLDEFDIFTAILGKLVIFAYSRYVAFPARKSLIYGLGYLKKSCYGEFGRDLAVDIIADADGDLVKVAEYVKDRKCNISCSLKPEAVS